MRQSAAGGLAIATLLWTPVLAAGRAVTVRELAEMLAAAQASRLSDEDIAREIAPVELTERLTETTLSSFSSAQGNRTKIILRTLADESAVLDPPAAELTTEAPPSPSEQKAILARAANYAAAYKNSLPDITCTKTERRFNDNPSEDKTNAGVVGRLTDVDPSAWDIQARTNIVGRLRERVDLVSETTVNHADPAASAGFGNTIRSVFLDDGAPQAVWSYWETIDSKCLAAFHYAIDPADSDFPTNSCCVEGQGGWPRDNVAYRGSLLIEPASGVIFRITVQAIDTSPGAVSHGNDAVIEYRSANISGKAWMCPYRAITLSDNTVVLHGFNVPVRTLDVVEFTNYRTAEPAPHAVSPLMGPPEAPQRGRPVTVRQLEQMLTSAHEARRSDNDIAQEIGRVELTERLTEATLSHFSRGERKLVKSMLQILADESAFLDPPPSELPADSPPGVDQQKAIMAQAFVYASAYIHNLPNFLCTQVIHRLDNDPARQKAEAVALLSDEDTAAWRMQSRPAGPGGLTERDTATNELTIRNGTESHRHTGAVSASPFAGGPYAMQGLTTSGEFGGMIGSVFSVKSAAKAAWSHWEMMAGKHAAVFNYSVDLAHSDFFIYWCCIDQERRKERVAYRGAVFIDPDSGGVLRISWQALNISDVIPTRSSDTVVDYRPVDEALNRISPQGRAAVHECPNLSYYLADRIVHFEDKQAIALATRKAQACGGAVSGERTAALAAEQAESQYRAQTKAIVAALKDAARRMSILPGSRTIVLVSPGFIAPDLEFELNGATDTAARAGVVINTLDARGVWVLPGFDAATAGLEGPPEDNATRGQNAPGSRVGAPEMNRIDRQYAEQAQQAQSDVLMQLADGTGGSVSHGNDFEAAFRRLMAAPEVSYILGFTPTKLKPDGSFHKLKLTVADRKGLAVQARNGYFAPKQSLDAAEQAKEEIENAVFSRDEIQDIPVTLKTQISHGKLSAIAHFGIGGIRFVNKGDGKSFRCRW
jgi:VWFA-related protein